MRQSIITRKKSSLDNTSNGIKDNTTRQVCRSNRTWWINKWLCVSSIPTLLWKINIYSSFRRHLVWVFYEPGFWGYSSSSVISSYTKTKIASSTMICIVVYNVGLSLMYVCMLSDTTYVISLYNVSANISSWVDWRIDKGFPLDMYTWR